MLTEADVALVLGVHHLVVRRLDWLGLPHVVRAGQRHYDEASVEAWASKMAAHLPKLRSTVHWPPEREPAPRAFKGWRVAFVSAGTLYSPMAASERRLSAPPRVNRLTESQCGRCGDSPSLRCSCGIYLCTDVRSLKLMATVARVRAREWPRYTQQGLAVYAVEGVGWGGIDVARVKTGRLIAPIYTQWPTRFLELNYGASAVRWSGRPHELADLLEPAPHSDV